MTTRAPSDSPKITPPRVHGVVDRERLFAWIDAATPPVVWIAGPPGAGKTTLAASYVEARKRPVLWYQLDAGDADPANFFHFVAHAAARIRLRRGEPLPRLATESAGNIAAFAHRWFRELFARLPADCVVVLDNFQDAADTAFAVVAREALAEVPAGRRVVVLCLTDPPDTLARLVANRHIDVIPADALLLTAAEADQILSTHAELDQAARNVLGAQAGGWAAGLVLMAEHALRQGAGASVRGLHSREAVFDYFAGEILAHATPAQRRVLMLTAAAPWITGRLARIASGDPGAPRLLEYLYRRHLFTDRRQGPEVTYHYHTLFRDFLRARAAQELADDERADGAASLARALEVDGYREEAVPLYLEARDFASAARLVLSEAPHLHAQGRARMLLAWIGAIPPPVVAGNPWLAYWAGATEVWSDPGGACAHLQQAFDGFEAAGDRDGQVLAAGAITRAFILTATWAPLDGTIATLAALLEGHADAIAPAVRLTGLSRLVYAAFVRQPQHPQLPAWASRTLAALGTAAVGNETVMAGYSLMQYYHLTGGTAQQEQVVRRIDPMLADPAITPISRCYWLWANSNYVLRTGAPRDAIALIDEAVELATDHGLAVAAVLRRYRIGHDLTLPNLARAGAELAALEGARRVEPYYEMRAWLALQRGEMAVALREAQTALEFAEERGRTYYRILDRFLLAVIRAEAGAFDEARAEIAHYRRDTAGVQGPLAEYHALLVDAYIAWCSGDRDRCVEPLRGALAIGERERYRSHWIWHPAMMVRLYGEALERGIAIPYVQDVIRTHAMAPASPDIAAWPWPINVRTLGGFAVEVRGEPLRFEGKSQRKPLDLLKALIALGGRDVPAHVLIELLWPEPLEDGGQKALEITVHRLRRLLRCDDAIRVTDRRVTLDAALVWVDAWTLERMLATLVGTGGGPEPAIDRLEAAAIRALELYRGEFLAGEPDASWLVPIRNRIAGRFQRLVLRLGDHWEARAQWGRALALYARATELDTLAELFYRRQMVCLREQGMRAEAIGVYRRCRQTLSVVLGVAPTAETEALFHELRAD